MSNTTSTQTPPSPPPLFRAVKAGSAIGFSSIASLGIGFFLQLSIAYFFGAGSTTDAFFMAQGTSELLTKILLGGSLTSVFLPVFVEHLTHNRPERAWKLANHLIHLLVLVSTILLGVMGIFTDRIIFLLAPGFSPETHTATVLLLRIMLPSFLFALLVDFGIAMLNSLRVFGAPAVTRLIPPAFSLLFLLGFAGTFGILTLAYGTLVGTTLQLVCILILLFRSGFQYRPLLSFRDEDVQHVLRLVAPFSLSVLSAQGAGIVYRILVSTLPVGSLSALKYGEKMYQITNTLFLKSITTVAFTAFSRNVAIKNWEEVRKTLSQAVRLMFFLGVPLTFGIAFLRLPVIHLLYERGSFTAANAETTSLLLAVFLAGLLANGISALFGYVALSLKTTRVSVLVTVISQMVSILFFLVLSKPYGVLGLALGSSLTPFVMALLYALFLQKRIPAFWSAVFDIRLLFFFVAGAALVLGMNITSSIRAYLGTDTLGTVAHILLGALSGSLAYGVVLWTLRVPEIRALHDILRYATGRKQS